MTGLTYIYTDKAVCLHFSGLDGEYGLESEEVFLTPEDENPLRRILQVYSLSLPSLSPAHTNAHTLKHTSKNRACSLSRTA